SDLRPDARHRQQLLEEFALLEVGEAVQLEGLLAHVQVGLDAELPPAVGEPERARRGVEEVADAVHVQDQAVRRAARRKAPQPCNHADAIRRSGGASAWQIATASASAA